MAKNNYGFKKKVNNGYQRYQPTMFGKLAICITAPSALVSFFAVIVLLFQVPQALVVTFVSLIIAFIGGILIVADIVIFNLKNRSKEPKPMDIGRMIHLLLGIITGIIIGYLIWGAK